MHFKRFFIILVGICSIACILSGCGGGSNESNNEMEFEQLEWPTYENAKQIPVPKSTMADVKNSTEARFEFYLANTTLEDFKDYVEECKDWGFVIEPIEQEYRYYAFNESKYELTVQHQEGDIMYVKVVEERFDVEIKLLHADKISADMYSIRVEIDGYYEDSSEQGNEAVAFSSDLKEGTHTMIVENDDDDDINGRIEFVVSEDGEYFEFQIECFSNKIDIHQISENGLQPSSAITSSNIESNESNNQLTSTTTPKEPITLSEAKTIFEDVWEKYDVLIDDFSELLEYCNETTFTSTEEIKEYENQWIALSDVAYALANEFALKSPPEEVTSEWETFADGLMEIGNILLNGSTMDANLDNHYDANEMSSVITIACDEFVAVGDDIIAAAKSFNIITEDIGLPASSNTANTTSSSSKTCEECGKAATKTTDLFGQTEYYCTTHYNEIMDIINMMESDVGKGTASKHTCEECSREGTHSIVGISGNTEYYCTTHYNELRSFLEIFG